MLTQQNYRYRFFPLYQIFPLRFESLRYKVFDLIRTGATTYAKASPPSYNYGGCKAKVYITHRSPGEVHLPYLICKPICLHKASTFPS